MISLVIANSQLTRRLLVDSYSLNDHRAIDLSCCLYTSNACLLRLGVDYYRLPPQSNFIPLFQFFKIQYENNIYPV